VEKCRSLELAESQYILRRSEAYGDKLVLQTLFAEGLTLAAGSLLLLSAFIGISNAGPEEQLTPRAVQVSRMIRIALGAFFLAVGGHFALQLV
jgi:hypothetical protein